jgi:hypothetical protein
LDTFPDESAHGRKAPPNGGEIKYRRFTRPAGENRTRALCRGDARKKEDEIHGDYKNEMITPSA